ncbi:MAG: immunoglobulin domain-containing protein, partial [Verrucomicrobia bacterium]|nr:immunoglobulin domain-containing protein [Verrucomicrobiota bacterium]
MKISVRSLLRLIFCLAWAAGLARAQVNLPHAQVAVNYTFQIVTSPAAPAGTTYAATGLPGGISLNVSSGVISGTATAPGTSTGVLTLTSAGVTNGFSYTLVVDAAAGTPAITSATTVTALVGQSFAYTATASNSATSFNLGPLPPGLSGNTTTGAITGTPTTAGSYVIAVSANNGSGTGATTSLLLTVNPAGPLPVITSGTGASGSLAAPFSYTITASNSPTLFAATGLPLGLSLNPATGVISGTPMVAGVSVVALRATNAHGTGPATNLTLTLGPLSTVLNATAQNFALNQAISPFQIIASNSPVSFNVTSLPAGLTVSSGGLVTGTPTVAGTFSATISANNAAGTGPDAVLPINIGALSTITSVATLTLTQNQGMSAVQLTANNSPSGFTATGLPPGLLLSSGGLLSGTPSGVGTFPVSVRATNAFGLGPIFNLGITVLAAGGGAGGVGGGVVGGGGGGIPPVPTPTAPVILQQPVSQTVALATPVTFSVGASGSGVSFQWSKDGAVIGDALTSSYTIASVKSTDAGTYRVVVSNSAGSATSDAAVLSVTGAVALPTISTQPRSQSIAVGSPATFTVVATGPGTLSYQWRKNNAAIVGATTPSLTLVAVSPDDAASYTVVVTNAGGSVTSSAASLTVITLVVPPVIATQPAAVVASVGGSATFTVVATGSPAPTYQWRKNGADVPGATSATLTLAPVLAADAGSYTVTITNSSGTVSSTAADLTVTDSRLVNFSIRANAGTGDQMLIVGLTVGGGAKRTLVRAVGPTLGAFGLSTAL